MNSNLMCKPLLEPTQGMFLTLGVYPEDIFYCAVAGYFRAKVSVKVHFYTRVSRDCENEIDPHVLDEAKK